MNCRGRRAVLSSHQWFGLSDAKDPQTETSAAVMSRRRRQHIRRKTVVRDTGAEEHGFAFEHGAFAL